MTDTTSATTVDTTVDTTPTVTGPRLPRRVLIANRGEIAVRIARTCRSLGIETVAVFSDADAGALHVEVCDQAVRIGRAAPTDSYLRGERIIEAARRTGADAVHPGFGFLAEDASFATAVRDAGLTWVGPPPDVIAAMGDKLEAKRRMAAAGVPLLHGAELATGATDAEISAAASEVGFPVMVKAAAGGGGKGMRVVHHLDDLHDAVAAARREAAGAFGDDRVFLERYIARSRHVEVQILGDVHGGVVHLFERECSIQRRHQKVVEESPSPGIDEAVREALCAVATDAARALGYVNAGTVEFIADEAVLARRRAGEDLDPREAFAFLEVNTRLQVEHPVTEEVLRVRDAATGTWQRLDLVRLQLLVAAGAPLPFGQADLAQTGHAIEARLYAEDVQHDYLPAVGRLHAFEPAGGDGIRWDSGVRSGDQISPNYDPMLAKAIAWAPTRLEAAARLATALTRTLLQATTNRDLLVAVLRDETFLAGDTTTALLEERFPTPADRRFEPTEASVELAVVAAALHGAARRRSNAPVLATLPSGFSNGRTFDHQVSYAVPRRDVPLTVRYGRERGGADRWTVQLLDDVPPGFLDGDAEVAAERAVQVHAATEHHLEVEIDDRRWRVRVHRGSDDAADGGVPVLVGTPDGWVEVVEQPRFPAAALAEVAGATLAPMPGAVVSIAVAMDQQVARGELLVTVEAMKMEHRVTAPIDGTVAEVRVREGDQVSAGDVLVVVRPPGADAVPEAIQD